MQQGEEEFFKAFEKKRQMELEGQVAGRGPHKRGAVRRTRLFNLWSRNKPLDGRCFRVGMVMANSVDAQFGVPNDVTIWLQDRQTD